MTRFGTVLSKEDFKLFIVTTCKSVDVSSWELKPEV